MQLHWTELNWTDFTLPCYLSLMACFADINVSQGSVATHAKCGGNFNIHSTANLSRNLSVKFLKIGSDLTELWPRVCGPLFRPTLYIIRYRVIPVTAAVSVPAIAAVISQENFPLPQKISRGLPRYYCGSIAGRSCLPSDWVLSTWPARCWARFAVSRCYTEPHFCRRELSRIRVCTHTSTHPRGNARVTLYQCRCCCCCSHDKKLSCRRGTARCVVSAVEILPIAPQQCRNYLYDKSWTKYQLSLIDHVWQNRAVDSAWRSVYPPFSS